MPVEQEPKSASDPAPAPPPLSGEAISESCCSRFALSQDRQVGVSPGITPAGNAEGALPLISEGLAERCGVAPTPPPAADQLQPGR
jgi:hypothetical protein